MYRFRLVLSKFVLPAIWLFFFGICLIAPLFPALVTKYYTEGFFNFWTIGLRFVFGWVPFALGEIIYFILIILLIINIINHINSLKIYNRLSQKGRFLLVKTTWFFIKLYVIFQFIWGLNYLQSDPAKAFQLTVQPPKNTTIAIAELNVLTYELIQELNQTKAQIDAAKSTLMDYKEAVWVVKKAYAASTSFDKHQIGQYPSIKKSIFPTLGDYIGYLAFYQPITGEAIIRADLPLPTQPFTIAHEMAHQLGYASETDANFIAFVVATESKEPILRYSMLLQIFSYAQDAQLSLIAGTGNFDAWKAQIAKNKALLNPAVLKDRLAIRAFFAARAGKQIQSSSKLYDQFLKWNQQAAGLASYADVLKWVRAYRLKTGSSTSYSR